MSVSSSCLVYSRLKPSLVSVLISVSISVLISVPISFRGQTRYGLGLISKKPSSFKKKPSFIQEKTEFFSSENRGQNKRPLGFLRWQLLIRLIQHTKGLYYIITKDKPTLMLWWHSGIEYHPQRGRPGFESQRGQLMTGSF